MKGSESPNANGSWSIEAIHAWVRAVEAALSGQPISPEPLISRALPDHASTPSSALSANQV